MPQRCSRCRPWVTATRRAGRLLRRRERSRHPRSRPSCAHHPPVGRRSARVLPQPWAEQRTHRSTINRLMKKIKRVGHGFRNLHNYRLRLLLHCGGVNWQHQPAARLRGLLPRSLRRAALASTHSSVGVVGNGPRSDGQRRRIVLVTTSPLIGRPSAGDPAHRMCASVVRTSQAALALNTPDGQSDSRRRA